MIIHSAGVRSSKVATINSRLQLHSRTIDVHPLTVPTSTAMTMISKSGLYIVNVKKKIFNLNCG